MALPPHASPVERVAYHGARVATAAVLCFLVAPILVIVPLSFTSGTLLIYPIRGLSLRWYTDFLTNPLWVDATRNSVVIAVATTGLATFLGTLAALGLHRARGRLRPLVIGLLVTPLAVPIIVSAVAIFYFYAWVGVAQTYAGLILAHTTLALPFVVITVAATLRGFDPNVARSAASLGASPPQVFLRVTLPLIAPGVVSGALFAFVTSFDELVVVLFLASPEQRTLPRQIWSGVTENISPTILAAAVVLILVSIALMAVVEMLRRRGERLHGVARR
jgi:putative spermidine/putrescine transport system permease protein